MSDSIDYNLINIQQAANIFPVPGAKVLVVGANSGGDCKHFVDLGAHEVHGLDVVENVGADFRHEKTFYHRMSAEKMELPDNYFDIVYCFATMEHVPNIDAAFQEMARVTKPGDGVFCVAAPLWNSPYGHHMGCFHGHPWVHLRMGRDEIIHYCKKVGISGERGHSVEAIVDYMLNPEYFNKRPSIDYISACKNLPKMKVLVNSLDLNPETMLTHELKKELKYKGFSSKEVLAVTHRYIGKKRTPSFLSRLLGK